MLLMTPADVAEILQVNPHTIRRWCVAHAAHLSHGATPGNAAPRRLTGRDLEVLRAVATLRAQGLKETAINERLAKITFVEVDNPAHDSQENPLQRFATPHQTAQDGLLLPVAIDALQKRLDAVDRHFERLERNQRDRVLIFIAGAAVGLVAAILLLLIVYMLMNV